MEANPTDQYHTHQELYDSIDSSLKATYERFMSASSPRQAVMLNKAVSFALISAQTTVDKHEKGYAGVVESVDADEIRESLLSAGVNYYKNKASYILHNMTEADHTAVVSRLEAEDYEGALKAVTEEYKGVAMAKGSFALAMLGTPNMACIDSHMARYMDMDPDDVYGGVVPEKYINQVEPMDDFPVADHVSRRFMVQWISWDAIRESTTTHDAWWLSLDGIPAPL